MKASNNEERHTPKNKAKKKKNIKNQAPIKSEEASERAPYGEAPAKAVPKYLLTEAIVVC